MLDVRVDLDRLEKKETSASLAPVDDEAGVSTALETVLEALHSIMPEG